MLQGFITKVLSTLGVGAFAEAESSFEVHHPQALLHTIQDVHELAIVDADQYIWSVHGWHFHFHLAQFEVDPAYLWSNCLDGGIYEVEDLFKHGLEF